MHPIAALKKCPAKHFCVYVCVHVCACVRVCTCVYMCVHVRESTLLVKLADELCCSLCSHSDDTSAETVCYTL